MNSNHYRLMSGSAGFRPGALPALNPVAPDRGKALEEYQKAIASGLGDKDIAAVVEPFHKN